MGTDLHPKTARIYAFPARMDAARRERLMKARMEAESAVQRSPGTDFGSAWYHEAAIEEASMSTP